MDAIVGILIFFSIAAVGVAFIFKQFDSKYPKILVDSKDRGVRRVMTYRTWGDIIVPDNLIKLLMNEIEFCGLKSKLNFHTAIVKSNFIMTNSVRVYDAILRHGYFAGIRFPNLSKEELEATQPYFLIDGEAVISLDNKGIEIDKKDLKSWRNGTLKMGSHILIPYSVKYTNEEVKEDEITSGKMVAEGYLMELRKAYSITAAANPFMAQLIASLPTIIIILLFGLLVYLTMQGLSDNAAKILEASSKMVEAVSKLPK